jgi:hypothetical protein
MLAGCCDGNVEGNQFLARRLPAKCYSLTISCFEWRIFLDGLALVGAGGVSRLNGDPS